MKGKRGTHCHFLDCPYRYEPENNEICAQCDGRPSRINKLKASLALSENTVNDPAYKIPQRKKAPNGGIIFTTGDIEFLTANHARYSVNELARIMGVKPSKITWEKYQRGLGKLRREMKTQKNKTSTKRASLEKNKKPAIEQINEPEIKVTTLSDSEIAITIKIYIRKGVKENVVD